MTCLVLDNTHDINIKQSLFYIVFVSNENQMVKWLDNGPKTVCISNKCYYSLF